MYSHPAVGSVELALDEVWPEVIPAKSRTRAHRRVRPHRLHIRGPGRNRTYGTMDSEPAVERISFPTKLLLEAMFRHSARGTGGIRTHKPLRHRFPCCVCHVLQHSVGVYVNQTCQWVARTVKFQATDEV